VAEYQELRVRLERPGAGDDYRVFVSGPAGEAAGQFTPPFTDLELENFVLKLSRPRSAVRRVDSPELDLVRGFGSSLFEALFSGRVRDAFRSSVASARNEGCGLRISLALTGTPELMPLPWEYLYDEPRFLSTSTWTPVVRYLDLAAGRRPLLIKPPLRILGMISSPSDLVDLDVDRERRKLETSLRSLIEQHAAEIHWLENGTLQALQRELRHADYHVFHYVGHGGYDRASEDGVLVLEDSAGRSRYVGGLQLGTILGDETTLRLAVLNACEGARTSVSDPFSGVATSLVQREIPAVIAMQFEITDQAAITFAGELYSALADGYAVDAALAEARKAILADENDVEWATPVLFMRVPDGRIFDIPEPLGVHQPTEEIPLPPPLPPPAHDEEPAWPTSPARRDEPPADEQPDEARISTRLLLLLAASAAVLLLGLVYPWDHHRSGRSWLHPFFGPLPNSRGGSITALSPALLVLLTSTAGRLAYRRRVELASGLLLGTGLVATGKYLGLFARVITSATSIEPLRIDSTVIFLIVLAAAFALIPIGLRLARLAESDFRKRRLRANPLLIAGGMLILIGCLLPYNSGGDNPDAYRRAILPDEGSQAIEPLLAGAALVVAALLIPYVPRLLAAGALIAVGAESIALWLRYVAIPLMEDRTVASPAAGGFVGLSGACLTLIIGLRLARHRP
jgi:CHAT domain